MLRRHSTLFFGITVALDILCAAAGWALTYAIRFQVGPRLMPSLFAHIELTAPPFAEFAALLPVVVACDLLALNGVGLYRAARTRSLMRESMRATKAAFLAWIGMLAAFYFVRQTRYSVKLVVLFLAVNTVMLIASRWMLLRILTALRDRGIGLMRAAIVGAGSLGRTTLVRLQANPWVGLRVEYFIDAEAPEAPPGTAGPAGGAAAAPAAAAEDGGRRVHGIPVEYCGEDFLPCLQRRPVDVVLVAVSNAQAKRLEAILKTLAKVPVGVVVMPDFTETIGISARAGEFEGMPMIQIRESPIYGWYALAKRSIDIAGALVFLALFGWLMALIGFAVKLTSSGPVIFRQERMGLGGKPFTMYKFRSMREGVDPDQEPSFTARNDARCTSIGRILRRTSLDELPQLFNVLKGDMSLVGPRPERPCFVRQFTEELPAYMLRHSVRAGMTGWAQINGLRGETSIRARLRFDLYYINNWSLQFDLFILFMTPFSGLLSKNAY